jgi:hypothetical protein
VLQDRKARRSGKHTQKEIVCACVCGGGGGRENEVSSSCSGSTPGPHAHSPCPCCKQTAERGRAQNDNFGMSGLSLRGSGVVGALQVLSHMALASAAGQRGVQKKCWCVGVAELTSHFPTAPPPLGVCVLGDPNCQYLQPYSPLSLFPRPPAKGFNGVELPLLHACRLTTLDNGHTLACGV